MAKYRKLGRTSSQRKALIRNQVTALLNNGKIVTTEAKAKEIRKTAEGLIALAVKEKDNFDEVTVMAKVARKDKDGKRVKEVVDGKKVTVYDEVEKKIKKDQYLPIRYRQCVCPASVVCPFRPFVTIIGRAGIWLERMRLYIASNTRRLH